jgi:hypothetical protein
LGVKGKLIKYYAMKTYGEVDVYIHVFLTSALDGESSASGPGRFIPRERVLGTLLKYGKQ